MGERREVTRAGIHAAESSAAFPGAGPKEPSGGPTTTVPRLHRLDCGFHASRSVGEAGFPRGSDSSPTARHRDPTAPGALWPGSTSPFTRPHLSKNSPASLQQGRRTARGVTARPNTNPKWEESDTEGSHHLARSPLAAHPLGPRLRTSARVPLATRERRSAPSPDWLSELSGCLALSGWTNGDIRSREDGIAGVVAQLFPLVGGWSHLGCVWDGAAWRLKACLAAQDIEVF